MQEMLNKHEEDITALKPKTPTSEEDGEFKLDMNTLEKTIEEIMTNNKSAKQDIAILMKQLRAANEARLE